MRVLLLDDDPMMRRTFARWADGRPELALVIVATPKEAEAALGSGEGFDLVACDFHLTRIRPGLTSATLLEQLHESGVRVAVLTSEPARARTALARLGIPVLGKDPSGLEALLAMAGSTA